MKNETSEQSREREEAAQALLDAAYAFWNSERAAGQYGAVKWLDDDQGGLVLFTRGEYRDTLMKNVDAVNDVVHKFASGNAESGEIAALSTPAALPAQAVDDPTRKALERIIDLDPEGVRGDDLGLAVRIAREALAGIAPHQPQPEGYRVFKDGNAWCAVGPGFIDLQASPAGFADTPGEALDNLMKEFGKEWAAKNGRWSKEASKAVPVAEKRSVPDTGSVSALRWLLNITTEFDRKDVSTRQAARLLDQFTDGLGRTNRERLESLWHWCQSLIEAERLRTGEVFPKQHPPEPEPALSDDTKRLDWLRENSCDLRCIDIPTGAGDADVHWVVIEHHMAKPHEREVGRSYNDEPREAIDMARAILAAAGKGGAE